MLLFAFRSHRPRRGGGSTQEACGSSKSCLLTTASLDGTPSTKNGISLNTDGVVSTLNIGRTDSQCSLPSDNQGKQSCKTELSEPETRLTQANHQGAVPSQSRPSRTSLHNTRQRNLQQTRQKKRVTFSTVQVREYALTAFLHVAPSYKACNQLQTTPCTTAIQQSKADGVCWLITLDWLHGPNREFQIDDYEWKRHRQGSIPAGKLRRIHRPIKRLKKVRGKDYVKWLQLQQGLPESSKSVIPKLELEDSIPSDVTDSCSNMETLTGRSFESRSQLELNHPARAA